jgi:hypothetical protein
LALDHLTGSQKVGDEVKTMPQIQLYNEFKSLLDGSVEEAPLQSFLERHPDIIVHTFFQGAYNPVVFPKFRLADEFIPDFVMIGHRSAPSWDVDLVEIEPAVLNEPLFNKQRQPTGRLRIAERQVFDWQVWIEKNREFFIRRAIDMIMGKHVWDENPFFKASTVNDIYFMVWYRIIIGRRKDFEGWGDEYRTNKFRSTSNKVEIVTWDRLLDKAKQIEKWTS